MLLTTRMASLRDVALSTRCKPNNRGKIVTDEDIAYVLCRSLDSLDEGLDIIEMERLAVAFEFSLFLIHSSGRVLVDFKAKRVNAPVLRLKFSNNHVYHVNETNTVKKVVPQFANSLEYFRTRLYCDQRKASNKGNKNVAPSLFFHLRLICKS